MKAYLVEDVIVLVEERRSDVVSAVPPPLADLSLLVSRRHRASPAKAAGDVGRDDCGGLDVGSGPDALKVSIDAATLCGRSLWRAAAVCDYWRTLRLVYDDEGILLTGSPGHQHFIINKSCS